MTFTNDIFYDTDNLSFPDRVQILYEAKQLCHNWRVDILDCSKSLARQKIDIPFDEILSKFDEDAHFVIIHRKLFYLEEYHVEIGFRAKGGIDYFLWIYLDEKYIDHFVNKYNLKPF